ncbi:MAG TPA: peroxiredoxin [Edaphocola sp.]|nr:peroxiredoxin [Edaphocola sp.]
MFKKFHLYCLIILALSLLAMPNGFAQSQTLSKGDEAPVFTTKASQAGKEFTFSLKEALAKGTVVLYFYPAAYTGGCDLEAHTFAEFMDKFTEAGTTIIGVSADDIQRLNAFSADPDFCAGKFPVASDPGGKIAATYGLKLIPPQAGVKDAKGEPVTHGFIPRTTFVINKGGQIMAVFSSETDKISPDEHVRKALEIVKAL